MSFLEAHPVLIFPCYLLPGLLSCGAIIYFGRRRDWFGDSHMIGRKEFERRLEVVFEGRQPLDDENFYSRFFAQTDIPKDIPIRIRKIFEEHLDADFSRIAATDDLSKELSCLWAFDSLVNVEIVVALEKEFDVSFSDAEAAETKTLLRIAEMIALKRKAQPDKPQSHQ